MGLAPVFQLTPITLPPYLFLSLYRLYLLMFVRRVPEEEEEEEEDTYIDKPKSSL